MSYRGRGRGNYNGFGGGGQRNGFNSGHQDGSVGNHPFGNGGSSLNGGPGVQVEVWGWNNASPSDLVGFLYKKSKVSISNYSVDQNTGAVVGYVKTQKDADSLKNWNGVRFAQQSLKINVLNSPAGPASIGGPLGHLSSNTISTVESLKEFLRMRYNPQMKMLDLSNMANDQLLVSRKLLGGASMNSSTSQKMFQALMKLASDDKSIVVHTVNLASNSLNDTFTTLSLLGTTFPDLLNLSLEGNNISRVKYFDNWKGKFGKLRELVLINNPLVQQTTNYQFELMKIFHRLILLDGQILRDEAKLNKIFNFPVVTKQMLFETPDIQNISTNFVANYLKLWDSNRMDLLSLYSSPESQFSLQMDSSHPANHRDEDANYWSYYLLNSRNLSKISNARSRLVRLHRGSEEIFKVFRQLPKTRHMLMESPNLFSLESYSYPQVNGIIITIHGEFEETGVPEMAPPPVAGRGKHVIRGTLTKRSFDRTFVVVQGPNQSMIIASDLLVIRLYAGANSWIEKSASAGDSTVTPAVSALPTPPVPLASNTMALLQQQVPPDILNALNPVQQQLLAKIYEETKLNAEFSLMLCQQSNWDYQSCINSFNTSKGNIPINAYQH